MSRDWVPAGSVPYSTSLAEAGQVIQRPTANLTGVVAQSVPYQGTVPYHGTRKRNPKKCWGNNNKCEGFKSAGTNYCAGHRKAIAKEAAGGSENEG